jgi:hypothetical protein
MFGGIGTLRTHVVFTASTLARTSRRHVVAGRSQRFELDDKRFALGELGRDRISCR